MATFIAAVTGTDTATLGAHQAGDVFLAFAFRDGGTLAITTPTGDGWSEIIASTQANNTAYNLGTLTADGVSEVAGTWTNATSLIIAQWRPGAGETITFGTPQSNTGASSLAMNYPALTLTDADGSSSVISCVGHRSANVTPLATGPTGSTNRSTVQDATDSAAMHENAGVTSWAGETVTFSGGSAGGYRAISIEMVITTSSTPDIDSVSDTSPTDGSTLVITGSNLKAAGDSTVTLGGVAQTVTLQSATVPEITVALGTNKYGAALDLVLTDSTAASSNTFSVSGGIVPDVLEGSYVNVGTPNTTAANRLQSNGAGGDIASGDQVHWYDVFGGDISEVTIASDVTFSATASVVSFKYRVWSVSGGGWGSPATITLADVVPEISSQSISVDGTELSINFSKTVQVGANGHAGIAVTPTNGGAAVTTTYYSGIGAASFVYTLSRTISSSEILELSYTNPGDGIEDADGDDVENVSGLVITNNSTVNTAPTDIALSNSSVLTTGGADAVVGSFTTTDADAGDTFTYSLVAGTGDDDNASFSISGANLRCDDPNALGAGVYSIRVRSTDSGSATYDEIFSITAAEPSANAMTLVRSISRPISMSISRPVTG